MNLEELRAQLRSELYWAYENRDGVHYAIRTGNRNNLFGYQSRLNWFLNEAVWTARQIQNRLRPRR